MQHSQRQADHLQVLASGGGANVPGSCAHIVDDALLQPRDEEVCALVHDLLLDTRQTVKDDGAGAALHVVDRGVGEGKSDGGWDGPLVNGLECSLGHGCDVSVCWYRARSC